MGLWEKAPLRLRRYLVYRREGVAPLALGPSVTVERLEKGLPLGLPEEVWADGRVYPLARTLEGYLALGHPGVVLRVEGRYAGHLFLRPPGTPPPPHLPWGFLPEPLPWAYGAFVRPEYRGRGLIRHALVALGRGWEEVYAEVRPETSPPGGARRPGLPPRGVARGPDPRGAQGALVALRPLQGGQRRRALRQPPSAQKRHGPKARERPTSEQ